MRRLASLPALLLWFGIALGPAGGLLHPAAAEEELYVLFGVYYLDSGRPFGSLDFGFRVGKGYCETQRGVIIERWLKEGGERRGKFAVWVPSQNSTIRLLCVPLSDFERSAVRDRLVSEALPKE